MARASVKAVVKPVAKPVEKAAEKPAEKPAVEAAAVKKTVNTETASSVIPAPDEEVIKKVVYQPSSEILERDAEPNESFGIGDAMPVYFL